MSNVANVERSRVADQLPRSMLLVAPLPLLVFAPLYTYLLYFLPQGPHSLWRLPSPYSTIPIISTAMYMHITCVAVPLHLFFCFGDAISLAQCIVEIIHTDNCSVLHRSSSTRGDKAPAAVSNPGRLLKVDGGISLGSMVGLLDPAFPSGIREGPT